MSENQTGQQEGNSRHKQTFTASFLLPGVTSVGTIYIRYLMYPCHRPFKNCPDSALPVTRSAQIFQNQALVKTTNRFLKCIFDMFRPQITTQTRTWSQEASRGVYTPHHPFFFVHLVVCRSKLARITVFTRSVFTGRFHSFMASLWALEFYAEQQWVISSIKSPATSVTSLGGNRAQYVISAFLMRIFNPSMN